MRVLICGDRNWDNEQIIRETLEHLIILYGENLILIEGEARGADSISAEMAEDLGMSEDRIKRFPAKWKIYGRAAGPIRNKEMLRRGKPDLVIAFNNDIAKSKGTKHMLRIANGDVESVLFTEDNFDVKNIPLLFCDDEMEN